MPSFKGSKAVLLQPADSKILITYQFPIKTSGTDTENYLPFGTTISGATITVTNSDGVDITTDIIYTDPIVSDNQIVVSYKYPLVNREGTYSVKFILQVDNGSTLESDFNRVVAKDL